MMGKKFVWLLGFAIIFVAAFSSSSLERAPEFLLENLDGQKVHSSNFKGKIVLLNFWATWCPPCIEEIPSLKSLHRAYQSEGVEVVGINLDEGSSARVKSFVAKIGIPYPILIGNDEVTRAFGGIRGIPTTFLIDRQGRVVKKFMGGRSKRTFEEAIQQLL